MLPPTPNPPPRPQIPTWAAFCLGGILVMIGAGIGALFWPSMSQPPIDAASTFPPSSVSVASGPGYDATASAALAQIAETFSTAIAPTPTPVPATATPTKVPPETCGPWAAVGKACEWPQATATPRPPMPMCITPVPEQRCRWEGVPPTPDQPWSPR